MNKRFRRAELNELASNIRSLPDVELANIWQYAKAYLQLMLAQYKNLALVEVEEKVKEVKKKED